MPTSADAFVVALHSWLYRWGGGGPFGPIDASWLQRIGPPLSRDSLLDRYETHTKHCRSVVFFIFFYFFYSKVCLLLRVVVFCYLNIVFVGFCCLLLSFVKPLNPCLSIH
jgi:hypothetical protein